MDRSPVAGYEQLTPREKLEESTGISECRPCLGGRELDGHFCPFQTPARLADGLGLKELPSAPKHRSPHQLGPPPSATTAEVRLSYSIVPRSRGQPVRVAGCAQDCIDVRWLLQVCQAVRPRELATVGPRGDNT